ERTAKVDQEHRHPKLDSLRERRGVAQHGNAFHRARRLPEHGLLLHPYTMEAEFLRALDVALNGFEIERKPGVNLRRGDAEFDFVRSHVCALDGKHISVSFG